MKTESYKLTELTLDPKNANQHPTRNLDSIKASLTEFGQVKPIVINPDGKVIAGNGTYLAAKELGWTDIHCVIFDTTAPKETAYGIADNRTAELAEWDDVVLADLLVGLDTDLQDVTGFTQEEIDALAPKDDGYGDDFTLPDGEKDGFRQVTFTLSDMQYDDVMNALQAAKDQGPFEGTGNENSNGNAIARVCENYHG